MATLADVLDCLNAAELKHILDTFDIASPNRKALAVMRLAILDEGLDPSEVLSALTVEELKWIAEAFELATSGRKASIIDRILSDDGDGSDDVTETESAEGAAMEASLDPMKARKHLSVDASEDVALAALPSSSFQNVRNDVDLSIFQAWLQGALNTGRVAEGQMNFAFCRACSRKHPRRWFNFESSDRSFYLCYAGDPVVVESVEIGSKHTTHHPTSYAKANELNEHFTREIARVEALVVDPSVMLPANFVVETTTALVAAAESPPERSFLSRLFGSGIQAGGHLVRHVRITAITSTPPFIEMKVDMEHVQAAIQKGKESWNS